MLCAQSLLVVDTGEQTHFTAVSLTQSVLTIAIFRKHDVESGSSPQIASKAFLGLIFDRNSSSDEGIWSIK